MTIHASCSCSPGWCAWRCKNRRTFAEAITIFRQVARAGSRDASILVNVAALALKIGYRDEKHAVCERVTDHRLALEAARQAIAVEPKLPVSYLIAVRLIINLTLYESGGAELESLEAEAKAHLGQAETVGADPASVATLRVALMLVLGQLDAAREFLTDTHPQPRAVAALRDHLAELDRPLTDRDRADMAHMWVELREFLASFPHFMARMGLSEDDAFRRPAGVACSCRPPWTCSMMTMTHFPCCFPRRAGNCCTIFTSTQSL